MQPNKNLPKNYKGYPTEELIEMYETIGSGGLKGRPKEMIEAMDDLLREYRLGVFKDQPIPLADYHIKGK